MCLVIKNVALADEDEIESALVTRDINEAGRRIFDTHVLLLEIPFIKQLGENVSISTVFEIQIPLSCKIEKRKST